MDINEYWILMKILAITQRSRHQRCWGSWTKKSGAAIFRPFRFVDGNWSREVRIKIGDLTWGLRNQTHIYKETIHWCIILKVCMFTVSLKSWRQHNKLVGCRAVTTTQDKTQLMFWHKIQEQSCGSRSWQT